MPDPNPQPPTGRDAPATPPSPRPATLWQVIEAVFWSFFGVRKGKAMQRDAVTIRPHQVILVGIVIAATLVVTLLVLVRVITRSV